MITLYRFAPAWGLPDLSPFVVKLETYMRMAGIEYEAKPGDPRKAPKRKLPYVEHDGKTLGDTRFVIEHLKSTFGDPLDTPLTPRDRAIAQAYRSMLEEHLYFIVVYQRWVEDPGWAVYAPVMREVLAKGGIPSLLRGFVLGQVRKQMVALATARGPAGTPRRRSKPSASTS
jgi:glutathione S-transferase